MNPSPTPAGPTAAASDPRPPLDPLDPPTARTQAIHDSMRRHESVARGRTTALAWTLALLVGGAAALVVFMLLRGG